MAKPRNNIVDYLVYLAARLAAMFIFMFDLPTNYRTVGVFSKVLFLLSRRHLNRAREHIRRSFPDWPAERVNHVAEESMRNLLYFGLEVLFMPRLMTVRNWHQHVRFFNLEPVLRLLLAKRTGLIMLAGHFGNFDLIGYVMATLGFATVSVFRPLDNPYINRFVMDVRERTGQSLLFKKGATAGMGDVLDAGGTLCFIADQDAGRKGLFVEFFGRPASTYKSIGLVAIQHRVPVVVGYGRRLDEKFHFEITAERVIMPQEWQDKPDPLVWLTQEYTRCLEQSIRRAPEQYWWVHRRWKHRPAGQPDPADGIA